MIANIFGGDGIIVLIVALVVLVGGSQLPKIARNVGLAGKEFRKAQAEGEEDAARSRAAKAQATQDPAVPPAVPLQATPAPAPAPVAQTVPAQPAAVAPVSPAPPAGDGTINLTPAGDALLRAREEQVRGEAN